MRNINILVVEGNNREDSKVFIKAVGATASENLKNLLIKLEPTLNIEIVNPNKDEETEYALKNMNKFNGIVFSGGAMRINDMTDEIKKHIDFATNCFKYDNKILAICWGLQVCSTAAGGKVAPAVKGAHIGIASNVKINNDGQKNLIYKNKKNIFTTPAFNFDEVVEIPNGASLLASDETNKVMGINFKAGYSEIWGLQYHPDYEYQQMISLSNARKERLLNNKVFSNEKDYLKHVSLIEEEDKKLTFKNRTCEVKNWLDFLKR
ncbi:gamma-glutamyl-gamma-aminobutyrate hydrolase family protein [Candidatus Pelagibacter sp.]|nr:gamma-glutamyl-gamma-aminobutyrate hydrolase family protein [Candidatus Pelagibacter sp.]